MSAIYDGPDGDFEPLKVLFTMHEGMNALDLVGPLEVFAQAQHDKKNAGSKAFRIMFAGNEEHIISDEGACFRAHVDYAEAMKRLGEIDVLIVPGGGTEKILKAKSQPLPIIKAFAELQKKNPARERTLMSVCTGSLFLGEAGLLSGLAATTHPDFITKLEIICSNAAQRDLADRTDVMEVRYVVNNLRFDLGENYETENPFVMSKKEYKEQKRRKSTASGLPPPIEERSNGTSGTARRPSNARKGSTSLKMSNTRRESVLKRANLRLGGLRVLTTSGVTSGMDGALYLVAALVSDDVAEEVARRMCYDWKKGVVVDGTDV